jgi:hypothetical protein
MEQMVGVGESNVHASIPDTHGNMGLLGRIHNITNSGIYRTLYHRHKENQYGRHRESLTNQSASGFVSLLHIAHYFYQHEHNTKYNRKKRRARSELFLISNFGLALQNDAR